VPPKSSAFLGSLSSTRNSPRNPHFLPSRSKKCLFHLLAFASRFLAILNPSFLQAFIALTLAAVALAAPDRPAPYRPAPYQPAPYQPAPAYKEEPVAYEYQYAVKDDYAGVDFSEICLLLMQ